ncbi:YqkE family protein [Paenibacillus sp. M1]|uniref:YqkE family protein n=1 Tax=Paenibacillus haidiansis TaxID=1574488 RepID=A0ABU7VW55_9BACL
MAKKKYAPATAAKTADKPATLKDLLGEGTIAKLKEQAAQLKQEEEQRREEARVKAEEERKAERKRLDNDFEHLLNTSKLDWHKFK